jgi:hypothetical protein
LFPKFTENTSLSGLRYYCPNSYPLPSAAIATQVYPCSPIDFRIGQRRFALTGFILSVPQSCAHASVGGKLCQNNKKHTIQCMPKQTIAKEYPLKLSICLSFFFPKLLPSPPTDAGAQLHTTFRVT